MRRVWISSSRSAGTGPRPRASAARRRAAADRMAIRRISARRPCDDSRLVRMRHVDAPLPSVLVVGLGDLGGRVLDALARRPGLGRLTGASRDEGRGRALAGQSSLVAELAGGPRAVGFERLDLTDEDAAAATLARVAPDVIVMAASGYTWWRSGTPTGLPYAVWLPLLVPLVASLMRARDASGVAAPVVSLPFPDVVGPVLAGSGLAPEAG